MAASLGVAGLGALASLAVYGDFFIALALVALGYSFFATFRKKNPTRISSLEKIYRFSRDDWLLLITTAVVVVAIFFPQIRAATLAERAAKYEGRGSVVSLDETAKRDYTRAQEEIRGLMPAMTMEFSVRSGEMPNNLRRGNRVRFTVTPQGADFVIEKMRRRRNNETPDRVSCSLYACFLSFCHTPRPMSRTKMF